MISFPRRLGSSAVPVRFVFPALFMLVALEGCAHAAGMAPQAKRTGDLHIYTFNFTSGVGGAPCAITPGGVASIDRNDTPVSRPCPGDTNCVRASIGRGDQVLFVANPAQYTFEVVFDPFNKGSVTSGVPQPLDPKTPTLLAGKEYSFNVVATNATCTPLDPKIIIDP